MNLSPLPRRALGRLCAFALFSAPATADLVIVQANGVQFIPANIAIQEGDTVRWVRTDFMVHSITEGTDGGINGNEAFHGWVTPTIDSFEHTFDSAFVAAHPRPGGLYDYFCEPHFLAGMTGTVTVQQGVNSGSPLCDGSAGNCPCGAIGAADHGCPNTKANGLGAALVGSGMAQVSNDSFNLTVSDGPANKPGLILAGSADLSPGINTISDSEGLLCVGGMTQRSDVFLTDASGNADPGGAFQSGQPFGAFANLAGSNYYQYWFRDPASSCNANNSGASNFNFTNSWTVSWTP